MSIFKENYELMLQLRDISTTYCTFIEAGGKSGDFDSTLLNKAIALGVKIKENRDYIQTALGRKVPTKKQECKIALSLLDGSYIENRLDSVITRIM